MTINVDSTTSPFALPGARLDRRDAEARQGRWMLELERGMLASGAGKGKVAAHGHAAAPQSGPAAVPEPMARAATGASAAGADAAAASPESSPGAQHGAAPVQGAGTGSTGCMPLENRGAVRNDGLSLPRSLSATATEALAVTGWPSGSAAPSAGVLATNAVRALERAQSSAPEFDAGRQGPVGSDALAEGAESAGSAAPASQFGERPVFGTHLFSLYVRQDGVHAFIRDAALGGAQARSVALAITSEMAAAGLQVAAVTINGRSVATTVFSHFDDFPGVVRYAQQPGFHHLGSVRKGKSQ